MNLKKFSALVAAVSLLHGGLVAETTRSQDGGLTEFIAFVTKFFTKDLTSFMAIGEAAERGYVIDSLIDLNRAMYDVEADKTLLLFELQRVQLRDDVILRSAESLSVKVEKLRTMTLNLVPRLKLDVRGAGFSAAQSLNHAAMERKMWISDLLRSGSKLEKLKITEKQITDGKAAIKSLQEAQAAVALVIDQMKTASAPSP